jgi:hypothetical protein
VGREIRRNRPVQIAHVASSISVVPYGCQRTSFIDLYKERQFALDANHDEADRSSDLLPSKAFGQLHSYIGRLPTSARPSSWCSTAAAR